MAAEFQHAIAIGDRTVRLSTSWATDAGHVRTVNEDSFLAAPPVFLVADGMGGHAHGDLASAAAVGAFRDRFTPGEPADVDAVLDGVTLANEAVRAVASDGAFAGTTLTGVALVTDATGAPQWLCVNVGDSRIYRLSPRGMVQVSVDHSVVQELVSGGFLSPEEAETHPERNVVTRALGGAAGVDADVWLLRPEPHDRFLLCSDGISKELGDREIARLVLDHHGPEPIAEVLVRAALAAGGRDNATAVVVTAVFEGADDDTDDAGETVDRLPRELEETNPRI